MEQIITFDNVLLFLFLITYLIIFLIQKAQFSKQKQIIDKYDKIFNIINVDEIEKYVQLQKRALELSYSTRETEIQNRDEESKNILDGVKKILEGSSLSLDKAENLEDAFKSHLDKNKDFMTNIFKLHKEEFAEIYKLLDEFLKTDSNNKDVNGFNTKISSMRHKFNELRKVELEKIK